MGHLDEAIILARTILGSPEPSQAGSVLMDIEICDDNAGVIIKGIDPNAGVLKILNCDEVNTLIGIAEGFAGAGA